MCPSRKWVAPSQRLKSFFAWLTDRANEIARPDQATAENLAAQSPFVGELFDQSQNLKKILKVGTRLTEFHTTQLNLSHRKDSVYEGIEIDPSGNDIAAKGRHR